MKFINKTPNGQITYCPHHNSYHLEFGNMLVHLSQEELKKFKAYVKSIDYMHYYRLNEESSNNRKLVLNVGANRVFFCLHVNEFLELRHLLSLRKETDLMRNAELINFNMIFN